MTFLPFQNFNSGNCLIYCINALKIVIFFSNLLFVYVYFLYHAFSNMTKVAFSLDVPIVFNFNILKTTTIVIMFVTHELVISTRKDLNHVM